MVASLVIIVFSTALVLYWFRYTCILLVRNGEEELRDGPAVPSSFNFSEVQNRVLSGGELDPLERSLRRDYQVLTYLVSHASSLEFESWEEKLLVWDYKLMRCWYGLTRVAAPQQAREAVSEMAAVLGILAGRIGRRAGVRAQA